VVHGVPNEYQLKERDLLGIDIGLFYKGFHTDMAETVIVGSLNDSNHLKKFIQAGWEALNQAINMAKVGNRVGHISKAIEETITKAGYSSVRALVGHGIGRDLHEDPQIPCFFKGKLEETARLEIGMTLAIEIIYNQGKPEVVYKNDDGWTIKTKDGSLSGLFEHTVAILKNGPEILTLRH
jgi:methionyl aminopeptidase